MEHLIEFKLRLVIFRMMRRSIRVMSSFSNLVITKGGEFRLNGEETDLTGAFVLGNELKAGNCKHLNFSAEGNAQRRALELFLKELNLGIFQANDLLLAFDGHSCANQEMTILGKKLRVFADECSKNLWGQYRMAA